jgi:hypothetical protein
MHQLTQAQNSASQTCNTHRILHRKPNTDTVFGTTKILSYKPSLHHKPNTHTEFCAAHLMIKQIYVVPEKRTEFRITNLTLT